MTTPTAYQRTPEEQAAICAEQAKTLLSNLTLYLRMSVDNTSVLDTDYVKLGYIKDQVLSLDNLVIKLLKED